MVNYLIGIEGGGTSSLVAAYSCAGELICKSNAPSFQIWQYGPDEASSRIVKCIKEIQSSLADHVLLGVGLSMSGIESEESVTLLRESLRKFNPEIASLVLAIESDTVGTIKSGCQKGGVVLIAGTGSNCRLLSASGYTCTSGGWAQFVADKGAASWIARKGVKAVFDYDDYPFERKHDIENIRHSMYRYFKITSKDEMLPHMYTNFNKSMFSGFAKDLYQLAKAGDSACIAIFSKAGRHLARNLVAVLMMAKEAGVLDSDECESWKSGFVPVICQGRVFDAWDFMRESFVDESTNGIRKWSPEIKNIKLVKVIDATLGAARSASEYLRVNAGAGDMTVEWDSVLTTVDKFTVS